ncbi:hypothetical protein H0H92_011351 [Tricholoma furcatifolium]|nr:hypothetical protein H0H92_011351 [Tricholoma furcatifolium]
MNAVDRPLSGRQSLQHRLIPSHYPTSHLERLLTASMKSSQPTDALLPTADQLILPFDFASLLKAAVEDEDRWVEEDRRVEDKEPPEEETVSVDVQATPTLAPADSSQDANSLKVEHAEDEVEHALNSNGKRSRNQASKLRKKAKLQAQANRDVYDIGRVENEVEHAVNSNRKRSRNQASKLRKKAKRQAQAKRDVYDMGGLSSSRSIRLIPNANQIKLDNFDMEGVKVAGPGYVGPRKTLNKKNWTLSELKDAGFEIMKWPERPCAITDSTNRIVAVLIGRPTSADWDKVISDTASALNDFRESANKAGFLTDGDYRDNRRGNFHVLASGVSMGGGRLEPGVFAHPPGLQRLLDDLLAHEGLQRIAHFQSKALFLYAPKIYQWICTKIGGLMKNFKRNFPKSIFPALTLNLGPQTQCYIHLDQNNVANGMCIVTALGNYNHNLGAHFIFADLKLAVEFPSGMSLALPSAILPHGNTPIQPGEDRFSITQYCAGGLVRWMDYGQMTVKKLCSTQQGKTRREDIDGPPGSRWMGLLNLFSKFDELEGDRRDVLDHTR